MPRTKSRPSTDICADCGATDPTWVSVNRAILLCTECCIVHRSLGRHISQIKSLHKSPWIPTQLAMVMALNSSGVNSIWEHSLLDPNAKLASKKPQPKDSLQNVKTEFIRSKHVRLTWAIRRPKAEGLSDVSNELGQQLHASARSSNLHTSARLLVQGADPNYFHDEKGSTPLHVAAKSNQVAQAELLMVYGADPAVIDSLGRTAVESARQAGHIELADRLMEACFDLTDRLSYFLCGRRPDHKNGQHLLVPDVKEIDAAIMGRSKLQLLCNRLFQEFAMDIYDEVDRREIETIWQNSPGATDYGSVPFLPVQPNLTTTRNQARQKLARLEPREFNTVVLDVLIDARRRQHLSRFNGVQDPVVNFLKREEALRVSQISDDEPLYDSVASDDDYAALTPIVISEKKTTTLPTHSSSISVSHVAADVPASSTVHSSLPEGNQYWDRLRQSDSTIAVLRQEVHTLQSLVERLSLENCDLRSKLKSTPVTNGGSAIFYDQLTSGGALNATGEVSLSKSSASPTTDANLDLKNQRRKGSSDSVDQTTVGNGHISDRESSQEARLSGHRPQRPASMYETRDRDWQSAKHQREESRPGVTQSLYQCGATKSVPLFEEISRRTNHVTKRIQELWVCIQSTGRKDGAVQCAEKIRSAVTDLTDVIPQSRYDDDVRVAVRQLLTGTARLQVECAGLQRASALAQVAQTDTYLHLVRTCAYDIAKATKILVTKFESHG